jgi:ABC-type transport system substrate-binding protein
MATARPVPDREPETNVETSSQLGLTFVGFRVSDGPFTNELLRRAVAHALDREVIADAVGTAALPVTRGGIIPPAMPGHSHRIALAYDLDKARELLAEAGYPQGQGLPKLRLALPRWYRSTDKLDELFGAIGARVEYEHLPMAECVTSEEAEMWIGRWTADYPDPDGFFRGLLRTWLPYRDEEVTELVARAQSCQDQDERMRLFHDLDRLLVAEQAALVPLWYGRTVFLRRPWVEGLWANPLSKLAFDQAVVTRDRAARS